jgi:hypothetical protein
MSLESRDPGLPTAVGAASRGGGRAEGSGVRHPITRTPITRTPYPVRRLPQIHVVLGFR